MRTWARDVAKPIPADILDAEFDNERLFLFQVYTDFAVGSYDDNVLGGDAETRVPNQLQDLLQYIQCKADLQRHGPKPEPFSEIYAPLQDALECVEHQR